MLTNQILQYSIDGLKKITDKDIAVLGPGNTLSASTVKKAEPFNKQIVDEFFESNAEGLSYDNKRYFKVYDGQVAEYVVVVYGDDDESFKIGQIAAFQIQGLLAAYKERFDREGFIKNLLTDTPLPAEVTYRAKKLNIANNARRVVFIVKTENDKDMNAAEILRNIFPVKNRDYIISIDEENIVLIKELADGDDMGEMNKCARIICDTIGSETLSKVYVSIGTIAANLMAIASSYKEARVAQEVGKVFEADKDIVNYGQLGIGRLIFQLPPPLCQVFINEALSGLKLENIEDELLLTVEKLFENNLNASETARQLFIHRNTLTYRLDKLERQIGLDLRRFEDAIMFKITMMVNKYLLHEGRYSD